MFSDNELESARCPTPHRGVTTLHEVARIARARLENCELCELRCRADRSRGDIGRCHLDTVSRVYKQYHSLNEETELRPAYRVFFSGCNFRCPFCDEAPAAFDPNRGKPVQPVALARRLSRALRDGARVISLLGGEPTLHVHTLLEIAAAAEEPLPLAVNSNMYMTPEVLDLLDGVVRWYLADFKFGNDRCARQLADVPDYTRIVRRNVLLASQRANIIVRHVLLPGHLRCCLLPAASWVAEHLPGSRFQLYTGYVPCGPAACDPEIGRLNTRGDVQDALQHLRKLNLRVEARFAPSVSASAMLDNAETTEVVVTIGSNGRIYCHDLTPELLPVLHALCPDDPELIQRSTPLSQDHEEEA